MRMAAFGVVFSLLAAPMVPAADFNGDGRDDVAIFRHSDGLWSIRNLTRLYYGVAGNIPVPGDYDGDGSTDVAVIKRQEGLWLVRNLTRIYFGEASDIPLAGSGGYNPGYFYVAPNGAVGIGTDNPSGGGGALTVAGSSVMQSLKIGPAGFLGAKLHVDGSGYLTAFRVENGYTLLNSRVTIEQWGSTPAYDVQVNASGDLCRVTSSARYKDNIAPLAVDIGDVLKLQPVSFQWKDGGGRDIGLVAEDVDKTVGDLVVRDASGRPDAVKYDRVALYLLEVVKAQEEKIAELEQRLARLEK